MSLINKIKSIVSSPRALVLMYHRVGNIEIDPWDLGVSGPNFESQLTLLKRKYNVIPVKDLVRLLNANQLQKNTVCITFDDGYQDNFLRAAPLLKKYDCPATFYISTGFTDQRTLFWWDILTEIFLITRKLPAVLQLGDMNFSFDDSGEITDRHLALHKQWKWPAPPPTQRASIYLAVWEYIRPLRNDDLVAVIHFLIDWAKVEQQSTADNFPMTRVQLKQLSSDKLFSLGVHTVNHPALGTQHTGVQQIELSASREFLYRHFDNYSDTVAYPYGHYNAETINIMKNENFEAGFTTEERPVNNKSDIYRLGRFQVKNWAGDQLNEQLLKWLSQ